MKLLQSRARKRIASLAAGVLLALFISNASAQWIVHDPGTLAEEYKTWATEAKRWKDQYDHYKQQLINLQRLNFMSSQFVDTFPERSPSYGMDTTCPGSDGIPSSFSEAFQMLAPNIKGNIVDEQRKICQRIVLAENSKYNETVKLLRKLIQRQTEYQGVESQRVSVGTSQGNLAANDNETQRLMTRTTMDIEFWQARMTAYDKYIEALKWDSDRLGKCALRGCKDGVDKLIGNVVQAAALTTALKAGK